MLRSVHSLYGVKLGAVDGEFGHVKDCYFDDQNWAVRYLVTDTGAWLPGRKVLISPHAFGGLDSSGTILCVNLTKRQIEDSPLIETHMPVSRQFEEEYYRHYGLPFYWQGDGLWGLSPFPVVVLPPPPVAAESPSEGSTRQAEDDADPHLRSTHEVHGYHLQATDGSIGHIRDFLVDDRSWAIRQLVVKTGLWFAGTEVAIPTSAVQQITYQDKTVYVDMTQAGVRTSPPPP